MRSSLVWDGNIARARDVEEKWRVYSVWGRECKAGVRRGRGADVQLLANCPENCPQRFRLEGSRNSSAPSFLNPVSIGLLWGERAVRRAGPVLMALQSINVCGNAVPGPGTLVRWPRICDASTDERRVKLLQPCGGDYCWGDEETDGGAGSR
ncbi:hypothetical protein BDP27DRAFT_1378631 [Rhodocollybia butyracea]|uniref:Uncharacterized protein n=1 Tax=Rhodocollybia butyracea TaxID=206335 RepID=A0A9P5P562_9AGAR|nr:hypothetical protein BDP27DRAFT_1378631 [Rhodocollybia butyracea]